VKWEFDEGTETWLLGDARNGCGVFSIYPNRYSFNVVVNGDFHFFVELFFNSLEEAKDEAEKYFNKLREEGCAAWRNFLNFSRKSPINIRVIGLNLDMAVCDLRLS
jgi:hypothetical protein